jgi:co-chaperonin GroES (HSP10)
MESKYLARFAKLSPGQLPLRGNRLLVEVLPKEEIKSAGGLFINSNASSHKTTTEQNRAKLAIVLVSGNGYYDEDGKDVALDVEAGAVIMVSEMGLKYYSEFPGIAEYTKETLALTRDSEIHAAWPSIEAYIAYQQALQEAI